MFWLPFNDQVGIHDSSWRTDYGGDIYLTSGSHGCVNTPYDAAEKIYNSVGIGDPVIVYYSLDDVVGPQRHRRIQRILLLRADRAQPFRYSYSANTVPGIHLKEKRRCSRNRSNAVLQQLKKDRRRNSACSTVKRKQKRFWNAFCVFGGNIMKIVVLAGGTSTEREVSIVSGTMVCKALREKDIRRSWWMFSAAWRFRSR